MKKTTATATATARAAAYAAAAEFIGSPVEYDRAASERAGYSVMMTADGSSWISDLGTRYEANRADGRSVNFWIEDYAEAEAAEAAENEAREAEAREAAAREAAENAAAIAEARREAKRTRATIRHIESNIADALARAAEAREAGDTATAEAAEAEAEAWAARITDAEAVAAEAAEALRAIDPRARMTAPQFLTIDPAEATAAIRAAVWGAARNMAARTEATAAQLMADYGEDAEQAAFLRAWERAADPARAAEPLALFLAREAGNALARERYGATRAAHIVPGAAVIRDKYHGAAPTDAVDTDFHAAGRVPSPEAAAIEAERLPAALAAVREEYREAAEAVARALAMGYSVKDAARALGITPRAASRALTALRAAAEIVARIDGERRAADARAISDRSIMAMIDRRHRAAAAAAMTAAARARDAARAEARATMAATPEAGGRLNAAAYVAMSRAYKPAPRVIRYRGRLWATADRRAAAAVRPSEVIRAEYHGRPHPAAD